MNLVKTFFFSKPNIYTYFNVSDICIFSLLIIGKLLSQRLSLKLLGVFSLTQLLLKIFKFRIIKKW